MLGAKKRDQDSFIWRDKESLIIDNKVQSYYFNVNQINEGGIKMSFINNMFSDILVSFWHRDGSIRGLPQYLRMSSSEYSDYIHNNVFPSKWIFRFFGNGDY